MTREEHLLTILIEECAEVQQRATKALRFSMTDPNGTEPGQELTNETRLYYEINDLLAVITLLGEERQKQYSNFSLQQEKMEKVEKYLKLSQKLGKL